jgi:hypothetical protein
LDAQQLAGDAVLFGLEQVEGYGACVVGVEQFLPLGGERDALLFHLVSLAGCGGLDGVEIGEDELSAPSRPAGPAFARATCCGVGLGALTASHCFPWFCATLPAGTWRYAMPLRAIAP